MKKIIYIITFLFVCFILTGCSFKMENLVGKTEEEVKNYAEKKELNLNITYEYDESTKGTVISQDILPETKTKKETNLNIVISKGISDVYTLKLAMVGDMLIHESVYIDAKTSNGYDFSNMIDLVKPLLEDYDLAYYNQESILGGVEMGLSTYPRFNSPFEVGDAMIDLGFNLVSLANNHTLDRGETAITNSVNYWEEKTDVYVAGSYTSQEARDEVIIKEKNNITYSFLSYTTSTNGLTIPSGKDYLVNVYDAEKAKNDIEKVRDKVDVVMVAIHWGEEYTHTPSAYQKEVANYLASLGVDIIIGAHPHVIQPITFIGDTLVIYSLGNFLSSQNDEMKLIELFASVDIVKTVSKEGTKITLENVGTELLYNYHTFYSSNGKWYSRDFEIYPFSTLNNSILSNFESIRTKYNSVITKYGDDINVNMFD